MVKNFVDMLRANPYVREKKLDNNISSFNFTNKAFWKGHWDNETVKSRGLFIDTNRNEIVARGYDKFFTLEECNRLNIHYKIKYPIAISRKENGYLGIFSVDKDGNLFFASKSTNEGWYAEEFERILRRKLGNKLDSFAHVAKTLNVTFVFEVISSEDKHIIEYNNIDEDVVLLDMIKNQVECDCYNYNSLKIVSQHYNLSVRSEPRIINNKIELIQQMQFADEDEIEGFVARDANGFMFKYKSYYYRYWKNLRFMMNQMWAGKDITDIHNYQERCPEPVHMILLPKFIKEYRRANQIMHRDIPPHIINYRNYCYFYYRDRINDIQ